MTKRFAVEQLKKIQDYYKIDSTAFNIVHKHVCPYCVADILSEKLEPIYMSFRLGESRVYLCKKHFKMLADDLNCFLEKNSNDFIV